MSLETVIQENTAAVRALSDLLARLSLPATAVATVQTVAEDLPIRKRTEQDAPAEQPAEIPATETAKAEVQADPVKEAAPAAGEAVAAVDYSKDVKPLLLKVAAAKGRDALMGLLSKYDVTKGDQLPQDKLADVLVDVNALLGAA